MRGKIKTARKEASKLHGATSTYLSLVDAGANETPFTLIKSKEGTKAMAIKKRGSAKKSHKPLKTGRKQDSAVETRTETLAAKMVIDGDMFETEEEVIAYTEETEWEAEKFDVTKNDDGDWEVRSDGLTDDDFDEMEEVATDEEGVTVFIGKRTVEIKEGEEASDDDAEGDEEASTETKDEEDDEEDDEDEELAVKGNKKPSKKAVAKKPVKKAAPAEKLSKRAAFLKKRAEARVIETKFDSWDARFSDGNTLSKTLKAGMEWDGLPPGYYEVQAAAASCFANIVSDEGLDTATKQEALNKAALDMAEIIGGLDSFFDSYLDADEETVAKAFEDETQREALAKWAESYGDFVSDPEGAAAANVQKAAKVANSGEPPAIDHNQIGATVADLVKKSLAPVLEQVEGVSATVEAIASRTQTKKAGSAEDSGSAKPRKVETKAGKVEDIDTWRRETQTKGVFG